MSILPGWLKLMLSMAEAPQHCIKSIYCQDLDRAVTRERWQGDLVLILLRKYPGLHFGGLFCGSYEGEKLFWIFQILERPLLDRGQYIQRWVTNVGMPEKTKIATTFWKKSAKFLGRCYFYIGLDVDTGIAIII